jgi:uncharacterized protein (TIGR02246 family)
MKQLLTALGFFSITCLFIACSNTASESGTNTAAETKSTFDLAAARKTIDSLNSVFSSNVKKGDSAALAAMYTADAKMMVPNMPASSGRSAIQSGFSGMFASMGLIDLKLTTVDVWGTEDLLAEEGTAFMSKDGKEIDKAKYIVLWKKEDGQWKLFRDIFNSDNTPPAGH